MYHSFLAFIVTITCAARPGRDVDARTRAQYYFILRTCDVLYFFPFSVLLS